MFLGYFFFKLLNRPVKSLGPIQKHICLYVIIPHRTVSSPFADCACVCIQRRIPGDMHFDFDAIIPRVHVNLKEILLSTFPC